MNTLRRWWWRKELAAIAKERADSEAWWAYVAEQRANPSVDVLNVSRHHMEYKSVPSRIVLP